MERLVSFEIPLICHLMERQMDDIGRNECSLTRAQCGIIHFLSVNREKDIFQRDIEERFKIRRSTVSVILSSMESGGYIERRCVDSDARLKKIVLTKKAVALDKRINGYFREYDQRLVSNIEREKLECFFEVLDLMRKNIERDESKDDKDTGKKHT